MVFNTGVESIKNWDPHRVGPCISRKWPLSQPEFVTAAGNIDSEAVASLRGEHNEGQLLAMLTILDVCPEAGRTGLHTIF